MANMRRIQFSAEEKPERMKRADVEGEEVSG